MKRILDCQASDFKSMNREELLAAIGEAEGRRRSRHRAHDRLAGAERLHRQLPGRCALRRGLGRVGHEVHDDGVAPLL